MNRHKAMQVEDLTGPRTGSAQCGAQKHESRAPSMRSHSDVNYFFFLLAGKTLRVLRRFRQGRVFVARRSEPLTGSAQYTTQLIQQKRKSAAVAFRW